MSAVIANTAPRGSAALYRRRRITNVVAITLACAAALFGLAFLGWILWTLLAKGLAHLGPSLVTRGPRPGCTGRLGPVPDRGKKGRHEELAPHVMDHVAQVAGVDQPITKAIG